MFLLQQLQLVVVRVKDPVASVALGDGHVRQQIAVVLVAVGPPQDDHLGRLELGQIAPAENSNS